MQGGGPGGGTYAAVVVVRKREALKPDGESHIARAHDVLDLEVEELGREAELLNDACVLARC